MPLHDWTRVPDNVFHAFHVWWLGEIGKDLNRSVLPQGYVARPEEWVAPFETDLAALEVGAPSEESRSPASPASCSHDVTATIAPPRLASRKERRIAIFSAREERRVAIVEILSPGNKDSDRRARTFEEKILVCVASGLHVLLVDLLPPTKAAPGPGAAVARAMGSEDVPESGRSSTSFECQPDPPAVRIYHQSFLLDRALPDAPLFLESGVHVDVRLERTYLEAIGSMPAPDRSRLENRHLK